MRRFGLRDRSRSLLRRDPVGAVGDDLLRRAMHRGRPVEVGYTRREDLVDKMTAFEPTQIRDELEGWATIAIRTAGQLARTVHAIGWRRRLANTWITSPLVAIRLGPATVKTRSGACYALIGPSAVLDRELEDHLDYALNVWGLRDIRPS